MRHLFIGVLLTTFLLQGCSPEEMPEEPQREKSTESKTTRGIEHNETAKTAPIPEPVAYDSTAPSDSDHEPAPPQTNSSVSALERLLWVALVIISILTTIIVLPKIQSALKGKE